MWNTEPFSRRRRRSNREFMEIAEIVASGRNKISKVDISSEMMSLWDAGLITDKDLKYKSGKQFSTDEDDTSGSSGPKYRKILKIME